MDSPGFMLSAGRVERKEGAKMRALYDHSLGARGTKPLGPDPWLTPSWAGDRRSARRVACRLPASFRESQRKPVAAQVANLSPYGCAAKSADTHRVGDRCWIILPTLESWDATIAWSDGALFGLDFARPLHRAVVELVLRRTNGSLPWAVRSG
jgi:hypothetical protein